MKIRDLQKIIIVIISLAFLTNAAAADMVNSGMCENGVCPIPSQNTNSRPNPAVARIVVTGDTTRSYGSGTLVVDDAGRYFILTCSHLFENDRSRKITATFPDRSVYDVRVIAIDRTWDLAILSWECGEWSVESEVVSLYTPLSTLHTPLFANAIPLGSTTPRVGDVLYYAGYGSTGQYLVQKGRMEGYVAVRNGGTAETLVITGSARQGDSGGPIVNERGELVGVLWGTDGRTICGTYNGRILQFIQNAASENRFLAPFRGNENAAPTPEPPKNDPWYPGKNILDSAGQKAADAAKGMIGESIGGVKEQINETIGNIENKIDEKLGGLKNSLDAAIQKIVSACVNAIYIALSGIGGYYFLPALLRKFKNKLIEKKD
jgi:hypothetical protein